MARLHLKTPWSYYNYYIIYIIIFIIYYKLSQEYPKIICKIPKHEIRTLIHEENTKENHNRIVF